MYAILTEGLGRRYGERWAVRDLDLKIPQGEVFGLLGPNGAGKTTTMRMLASLIAPSAGHAAICGFDVLRDAMDVRRSIGILTEAPGLYETQSAQRNLEFYARLYALPPDYARSQIERYMKMLGLWERRRDRAGTFSKGMKQKLSLARALLHEPKVIILDEPTSALDPEGARLVRDCIADLKSDGRTIILCTHNLHEAQSLCDRVAVIKGTLLRVDTPGELRRSMYSRQVEVVTREQGSGIGGLQLEMERLVAVVSKLQGVGEVAVDEERLLVSVMDPEEVTPDLVSALAAAGAKIVRVAEVEHTLERAYLDLVDRYNLTESEAHELFEEAVA
jgi:ABC-2 type transport system ATP-binding protein